jgi:D-lactate dehydrogenase
LGLPEAKKQQKLEIFEPVEFTHDFLLSRLRWTPREEGLVYHTTCSSKRMAGVDQKFLRVLKQCTGEAPAKRLGSLLLDSAVPCCGMAGDRGLSFPELPRSALKKLRERVASHPPGCSEGLCSTHPLNNSSAPNGLCACACACGACACAVVRVRVRVQE